MSIYAFGKNNQNINQENIQVALYQSKICHLDKVIDGDTIAIDCQGDKRCVRLLDMDAPEMKQKQWGVLSKKLLTSLLTNNNSKYLNNSHNVSGCDINRGHKASKQVVENKKILKQNVRVDFRGKDFYNRDLAHVFVNDVDVGLELVKNGLAVVYPKYNPPKNYLSAMKQAKKQKIGIWSKPGLQQNPRHFRQLSN